MWKIKLCITVDTIFWPVSQRRVQCHTAELERNQWVSIDRGPWRYLEPGMILQTFLCLSLFFLSAVGKEGLFSIIKGKGG
jgi:hypothetical protein